MEHRERFESLFSLCSLAWEQFNVRRTYEMKISLSFWTALAFAIAGSLTLESFPSIPGGRLMLLFAAIFAFVLHLLWCLGIGRAQRADRLIAFHYERRLQYMVEAEFDSDLKNELKELKKRMGYLRNWTYLFQLGVTAFLAISLVAANWSRFDNTAVSQRARLEETRLTLEVDKLRLEIANLKRISQLPPPNAPGPANPGTEPLSPVASPSGNRTPK